jgi:sensor histidine kinase regulating citrate/malate metabolism
VFKINSCASPTSKGIDKHLEELRTGSYGIGIISIKQCVEELGGQLVYRNANPGTAVEVSIPVTSAKRKAEAVTVPK